MVYRWYDLDGAVMDGPPNLDDILSSPQEWFLGLAAESALKREAPKGASRPLTIDWEP